MMGIVEEGEEVIAEGKKKDETAADLALIGAAQKVEHYEMSGYITARNLAQQLHMAPISLIRWMSRRGWTTSVLAGAEDGDDRAR